jgi:RNA polymerase sigma factor (sigma-70 family)
MSHFQPGGRLNRCESSWTGGIVGTAQLLSRSMAQTLESANGWPETDFRAVFLQHYPRIVGVLVRLVGDRTRAEELANDVFWRLYREPALRADGNLGGWLYRTATNLGIDTLRALSRRRRYEEAAGRLTPGGIAEANGPLEDVLREEKCRLVRTVLASIKPAQAQLLILRASGFSYKELAGVLEVKVTGIGTMLNRAAEEFRNRYRALHGHEEEI